MELVFSNFFFKKKHFSSTSSSGLLHQVSAGHQERFVSLFVSNDLYLSKCNFHNWFPVARITGAVCLGSACLPASWYCFMLKLRSRVFIYRSKRWSIELLLKICSGAQHLQVLLFQEIICATTGKLSCNLCEGQVMLIRNYRISGGQGYAQCCMIEHSFKMSCMQLVAHVPQIRNPCASVIKVFSKCFWPYQISPPKPGLTLMVSSKS